MRVSIDDQFNIKSIVAKILYAQVDQLDAIRQEQMYQKQLADTLTQIAPSYNSTKEGFNFDTMEFTSCASASSPTKTE